jgi:hypothetical protein
MLPFNVTAVVLCDDIRFELNNKQILVGVYNGTIVVSSFPAEFPVCWWIQTFASEVGKFELDVQLIKDEKDILIKAEIGFEIHTKDWAVISLPRLPLQLHGPGRMKLQMKVKGDSEWTIIQELETRLGDVVGGSSIKRIAR